MDIDNDLLERAFISLVATMIEQGDLKPRIRTHNDFAVSAFCGMDNPVGLWKNLRVGQNTKTGGKKAQSVTLKNALCIAMAVGQPLSELLVRAKIMLENGWTAQDDVMFATKKQTKKMHAPTTNQNAPVAQQSV